MSESKTWLSTAVCDCYNVHEQRPSSNSSTDIVHRESYWQDHGQEYTFLDDRTTIISPIRSPRSDCYVKFCTRTEESADPLILDLFNRDAKNKFHPLEQFADLEGLTSGQVFTAFALAAAERTIREIDADFDITRQEFLIVTFINDLSLRQGIKVAEIPFMVMVNQDRLIEGALINQDYSYHPYQIGLPWYTTSCELIDFPCEGSFVLANRKDRYHDELFEPFITFGKNPDRKHTPLGIEYLQRTAQILNASLEFCKPPAALELAA